MAVMNINSAWAACLCGNSENDFVMKKIVRDLDIEQDLIECESYFWNSYVLAKQEPPFVEKLELVENCLKGYFHPQQGSEKLELTQSCAEALREYLALQSERSKLKKQIDILDKNMKTIALPILDLLKERSSAVCRLGNDSYELFYTMQERKNISKDMLVILQQEHPEIYQKFVSVTSFPVFRPKSVRV